MFALDPLTLRWVQTELTAAMDWYTRCITGIRLTPVSTKSVDASSVLYQTYRPRPAGASWPQHAVWPDHGIPRAVLLEINAIEGPMAEAAASAGWVAPALAPETVVVDHGMIYVSEHLTSVCQRMGISVQPVRLRPVYILGEVKTPGEYQYRAGMSVLAAISVAGGYTFRAQQDAVEITRTVNGRPVVGKATAADMIQPGDTVRVHEKWF